MGPAWCEGMAQAPEVAFSPAVSAGGVAGGALVVPATTDIPASSAAFLLVPRTSTTGGVAGGSGDCGGWEVDVGAPAKAATWRAACRPATVSAASIISH